MVYTKGSLAPTTLAHVTYITLKISHPNIDIKRNTVELFNRSAPYYLTLYTERYPAALSVIYAVSATGLDIVRIDKKNWVFDKTLVSKV